MASTQLQVPLGFERLSKAWQITNQDGDRIPATVLNQVVKPINDSWNVFCFQAGLVDVISQASGNFRYQAPKRVVFKNSSGLDGGTAYTYPTTVDRPTSNFFSLAINRVIEHNYEYERLDGQLSVYQNQIIGSTLGSRALAVRQAVAINWHMVFYNNMVANKDTATLWSKLENADFEFGANADLEILRKIGKQKNALLLKVHANGTGENIIDLRLAASRDFITDVESLYSARGRNNEYIQMGGKRRMVVSELPIFTDDFIGRNNTAGTFHSTWGIDLTNIYCFLMNKWMIKTITKPVLMNEKELPGSTRWSSHMKSQFGSGIWPSFKEWFHVFHKYTDLPSTALTF